MMSAASQRLGTFKMLILMLDGQLLHLVVLMTFPSTAAASILQSRGSSKF